MTDASNNTIYTGTEIGLLQKLSGIRLDTIDNMIKDGKVPDKVGEIRVLNEMITAAETNIQKSAENRLKHQDSMNKDSLLDTVAEMLKVISKTTASHTVARLTNELPDTYLPTDIVEGEIEIQPEALDPSKFLLGDQ